MTDQPKPLTDEDLRDLEQTLEYSEVSPADVRRLVAEVRRLRGVVRGVGDLAVGSDAWCRGCDRTLISQGHGPGCPIGALEAEAGESEP